MIKYIRAAISFITNKDSSLDEKIERNLIVIKGNVTIIFMITMITFLLMMWKAAK